MLVIGLALVVFPEAATTATGLVIVMGSFGMEAAG